MNILVLTAVIASSKHQKGFFLLNPDPVATGRIVGWSGGGTTLYHLLLSIISINFSVFDFLSFSFEEFFGLDRAKRYLITWVDENPKPFGRTPPDHLRQIFLQVLRK